MSISLRRTRGPFGRAVKRVQAAGAAGAVVALSACGGAAAAYQTARPGPGEAM